MRFLHTADLHIGKIVNDFSMLEDQKYILQQIAGIAIERKVTGVLLAGDIYDRAIPTGEAVLLLDEFLNQLTAAGIRVFFISGNHDSAERISFGGRLLAGAGVGIGGVYKDKPPVFLCREAEETVEVVLLPFVKPAQVDASTSAQAVQKMLNAYWQEQTPANGESGEMLARRILVTHYFVTDAGKIPELSDSETTVHIGGLDQVEASLFEGFDYVALGHIHKTQQIGDRMVYYAGSPLKYSFGEVNQEKNVLLIDLEQEGRVTVEKCPLRPLREMRKIKGTLSELMHRAALEGAERDDYIQAILTDEDEIIDPIGTLRSVYPNVMQIVRENKKTEEREAENSVLIEKKDPMTLFEDFYELIRQEKLPEEERKIMEDVIKQL